MTMEDKDMEERDEGVELTAEGDTLTSGEAEAADTESPAEDAVLAVLRNYLVEEDPSLADADFDPVAVAVGRWPQCDLRIPHSTALRTWRFRSPAEVDKVRAGKRP